jgi:5-methylcytosine-specific restriction endonuclease McrA
VLIVADDINPDKARPDKAETKARRAERRAEHRRQNIEKYLAAERASRVANRESRKKAGIEYRASSEGKAQRAAYQATNREKIRAQKKSLYAADPERHRAYGRKYRQAHPDKTREKHRRFKLENPNKYADMIAALAARKKADPELNAACCRNRQARKKAAGGRHTSEDVRQIYKAQRGKCAYCQVSVAKKFHVDHIHPLAKGGSNDRRNLQILCAPCNQSKNASDPIAYARSLGLLL